MSPLLLRLGVLALVIVLVFLLFWAGRIFVEYQRRQALKALPLDKTTTNHAFSSPTDGKVRILAFSSADCTQCHTRQRPTLRRLQERQNAAIDVIEIDAPASPELVKRYHILTVPSTVILGSNGEVHAVNYGFATLATLQQQINGLLTAAIQAK